LRATIAGKLLHLLSLLLVGVLLGAACGGGGTVEQPSPQQEQPGSRTFEMGLSSLPEQPTKAGYEEIGRASCRERV
jgi:Na+-transporting NADH:ubiquinone oxidoreductase subunit NqrF